MSFQAHLATIECTTGNSIGDFRKLAAEKGFTRDRAIALGVKATQITDWLKAEFGLGLGHGHGHGHAMAIYALLKGSKQEGGA